MPELNVLSNPPRSDAEYLRLFDRAVLHWLKHLSDEADVEVGVAFANRAISSIDEANICCDLALPPGVDAAAALQQVDAYYARCGTRCLGYCCHPDISADALAAFSQLLAPRGYRAASLRALVLESAAISAPSELPGVTIIPARASYKHAIALAREFAPTLPAVEVEEATWLHLDDPRYDQLLAIDAGGRAIASVGMLAIGDVGLLRQWRAVPDAAGDIASTMLARALEISARSLFRHVLAAGEDDATAARLEGAGFREVGSLHAFRQ